MQRIIDTSQQLANMNMNHQVAGTAGVASGLGVKNQSVLSPDQIVPADGLPPQNQGKILVLQNYQSVFSP